MRRLRIEEAPSRAALWSLRLALLAAATLAILVWLVRADRLSPEMTLIVFAAGLAPAVAATACAVLAYAAIWRDGRPGLGTATRGLILALALLAAPTWLGVSSLSLPKLNDVTTDLIDPPAYSRSRQALAARGGWTPPDASPETRAAQKAAYPRVAPFLLDVPAAEAFALAGRTAEALGWRIVERTPPGGRQGAGRIEAIERSAVLRFPDHIAIRVRPLPNGARLDVRSVSRVGEHDLGTNAARIERFLAAAAADLEAQSLRERR